MKTLAALALLCLLAGRAAAGYEEGWPMRTSMHYSVRHEAAPPAGFTGKIERIHRSLRREFWSLSRWMDTEKIHIYLYRDLKSYRAGSFSPPSWSNGQARYSSAPNSPKQLLIPSDASADVIAHETAHLLLGSYFMETKAVPPNWLNEGLAVMMGRDVENPKKKDYRGPKLASYIPLRQFFSTKPGRDAHQEGVNAWYGQAESLVRFLKATRPPFNFTRLCKLLREGSSSERALFQAYSFRSVEEMQKEWLKWAAEGREKRVRIESRPEPSKAQPPSARPSSGEEDGGVNIRDGEGGVPLLR
ncbi:MAG: hypothetical protein ABIJ96_14780 [Elusimicrobiota bacterium]